MAELDGRCDAEFVRLLVQSDSLRAVPDHPACHRHPLGVQQRDRFQQHVDALMRHEPSHDRHIDRFRIGVSVRDLGEVNAVGRHADGRTVPQRLAQPLGGLGRCGDDVVGRPHCQGFDQPCRESEPAEVVAPVGPAPDLVPGDDEPLALRHGHKAEHEHLKERDVVGLKNVEVAGDHPQTGEPEGDRLPQ